METKRQLKADVMNAELRAARHFTKLQDIDKIITMADREHEMAILTLNKIKKVLEM